MASWCGPRASRWRKKRRRNQLQRRRHNPRLASRTRRVHRAHRTAQDPITEPSLNHLAKETSPYLLQHARNPVDWYPWGDEALQRAKAEDKPIFVSIGYSACHWCHVMEHESFENKEIAAYLNEHFINIKVDREERPDLDEIYMTAVVAMTGQGGWPMTVFMNPDLKPFFGGTYFPPEDKFGRPGFKRVAEAMVRSWNEDREKLESGADALTKHLEETLAPVSPPGDPEWSMADKFAADSAGRFDAEQGGFGQAPHFAPKFPHVAELRVLLRHHARTGNAQSLAIVVKTLDAMANGGIHDQIGGGFHRYSTDRAWLVPHFEKMLYDNAQLVEVYTEAYLVTGEARFAVTVRRTLDYLLREMRDPVGGIWSTTDADSEGVEGKFFVWTEAEIDALLGEDEAAVLKRHYGVKTEGNWEGHTIFEVVEPLVDVAKALDLELDEAQARLSRGNAILYAARAKRVPPGLDDKVLAAWNGMALSAFARSYQVFGDPRDLEAARGYRGVLGPRDDARWTTAAHVATRGEQVGRLLGGLWVRGLRPAGPVRSGL